VVNISGTVGQDDRNEWSRCAGLYNGSSVQNLISSLKSGENIQIEPIRIVEKDGMVFTLDNRRLYAFKQAGVEVPYVKLSSIPKKENFKFTTTNSGTSIEVRNKKTRK
jgi:hypothetical protein